MNRNRLNLNKLQELRNGLLSSLKNIRNPNPNLIVTPILDGLVEASTSFGRQGKGSDFAQLSHKYSSIQNSPSKKVRFWSYRKIKKEDDDLVQFRMDRKTTENAEHEEDMSECQYEIPLVTPGPTTERTLLVVTLKLKRLSLNKSKGMIEREERAKNYEHMKNVMQMLKGPQTEKEIIFDHVKNNILSRIIECAIFRAKIRQYHRQKNEKIPPDGENDNDAWEEPPQVSEEKILLVDDQTDAKNLVTPPDDGNNNDETEEPPNVSVGEQTDAKTPVEIGFDPFEQISRIVLSISDNAFYRVKVYLLIFIILNHHTYVLSSDTF